MKIREISILCIFFVIIALCSCTYIEKEPENFQKSKTDISKEMEEIYEKGYDLPIKDEDEDEAEKDCVAVMAMIQDIYNAADKGDSSDVLLTASVMEQMKKVISREKKSVICSEEYSVMGNYLVMEKFLHNSEQGIEGDTILYDILRDGSIERKKYIYDGKEMYLLVVRAVWNDNGSPGIEYSSYTRIKEWRYTEKGWFAYELCVPEPPEVTEIVDGSCMIRIKPLDTECIELSKKCVFPLGYQGNNLLCSNWDSENMDALDYNGIYEYLYAIKYQQRFNPDNYLNGIPKEEFERLLMEYLPITTEEIREYAVFDEETQMYIWERLGCGNYDPTFWGTSIPEVVDIKENMEGMVILTVNAVCDMVLCDDEVITHELTVRFREDGSFQYLGNKILNNGIVNIPDYQYRINKK